MDAVTGPLLEEIDRFLSESGMSANAFGIRAAKDRRFVPRLRAGTGVTSKTVTNILEFIAKERAAATAASVVTYIVAGQPMLTGTVIENCPDGSVVVKTEDGRLARLPRNSLKMGT